MLNKIVEMKHEKFEFYINGKPTGQYMRGKIIAESSEHYSVESLSNGRVYIVCKDNCTIVTNTPCPRCQGMDIGTTEK